VREGLPAGWELTKIGRVVIPFESIQPNRQPEESFRYVDIGCIDNEHHKVARAKTFKGSDAPSRARRIMRKHDVLFSTVRTYLKNIALVPPELDGALEGIGVFTILTDVP
jgi:type I restriction enzyme S subunit